MLPKFYICNHLTAAGEGSMLNLTKPGTMFTSLARLPAKLVSQLGATDQPFHHHQQQMVDDTGMKKVCLIFYFTQLCPRFIDNTDIHVRNLFINSIFLLFF